MATIVDVLRNAATQSANINTVARGGAAGNVQVQTPVVSGRARTPAPWWQLAGQVPAGLLQTTVADTSLPRDAIRRQELAEHAPVTSAITSLPNPLELVGRAITGNRDYRPAIFDQPGALYGIIQTLVNTPETPEEQQQFMESYGGRSIERVGAGYERVNELLGVNDPSNPAEVVANVGGSLLVPITKNIPITATSLPGRAAQIAGRTALELAVPLRQTSLPLATAVAGTVGVGINELVDQSQFADPRYTGIGDLFGVETNERGEVQNAPEDEFAYLAEGQVDQAPDEFDYLDQYTPQEENDEFAFLSQYNPDTPDLVSRTGEDEEEDAADWFNWRDAAVAAGVALGGAGLLRYVRNRVQRVPQQFSEEIEQGLPTLSGLQINRSRRVGGLTQSFRTMQREAFQKDQPIRDADRDWGSAAQAEERGWDLDRLVQTSLGARFRDFTVTGRAPGVTGVRYEKIAPVAEAYGRELAPEQRQWVRDSLLAARGLDDRAWLNGVAPSFANTTDAQLRAIRDRVMNDPALAKYYHSLQKMGRDQLDFAVRRGLLTNEVAGRWARKRPNFAPFDRAVTDDADMSELTGSMYTANRNAVSAQSATEQGKSIQEEAAGDPFVAIMDRWSNLIRMAEMNDVRAKFLRDAAANSDVNPATGRRWVRHLSSIKNVDEHTHVVFENGHRLAYKVEDPHLSRALHFMPRASIRGFEIARQIMQNTVTGPLGTLVNLFAAAKAPVYDALLGMALQKKGVKFGNLNELMMKLSDGNINIGRFDPTAIAGGYVGAGRYLWDGFKQRIGTAMEERLFREHSWLRDMIGTGNTQRLATLFTTAWENSVRAELDQLGATSHTLHGSPDPTETITNLQDIAPSFHTAAAEDIYRQTLKTGPGFLEARLAQSRNLYARGRASVIARAYAEIVEAMHNGFRHQALATMRQDKTYSRTAAQRGSLLRRLSADASQYGGSQGINKFTGAVMYSGLSMQVLHEIGMMARKNPVRLATNIGIMAPMIMGLHYLSMMTDEETLRSHMEKTPEQRAAQVSMFGGAELPIDPAVRMILSPLMTLFDELTGINEGNPNLHLMEAFSNLLDGSPEEQDMWHEMEQAFWANLYANDPTSFSTYGSGIPGVPVVTAAMGIDPGMTRFSGEATPIREQQISGADQNSQQPDAMMTSWWQEMIGALTGTFGSTVIDAANAFYRSRQADGSIGDAISRAGERWQDSLAHGAGPLRPLFGDYEHVIAVGDGNWQQLHDRSQGVEAAVRVYNQDVRTSNTTSMSRPMPLQTDQPLPDFQGTQAAVIGSEALFYQRETADLQRRMSALRDQGESIRANYNTPRQETNEELNQNTRMRRALALQMLRLLRAREQRVGALIGDPHFTFEGYNPRDYMQPMEPVPVQ